MGYLIHVAGCSDVSCTNWDAIVKRWFDDELRRSFQAAKEAYKEGSRLLDEHKDQSHDG
jgi:hypothetical protein